MGYSFHASGVFRALAAAVTAVPLVGAVSSASAADEAQGVASSRMSYSRFLEYLDMGRVKKVLSLHAGSCANVKSKLLFLMACGYTGLLKNVTLITCDVSYDTKATYLWLVSRLVLSETPCGSSAMSDFR